MNHDTAALLSTIGHILIVDDDQRSRDVLKLVLEGKGHRVSEAENGEDALKSVEAEPPDVVLLDVVMPKIDGFEACRRLKADPRTAHIPVLMVTGLTERDDRIKGIDAGANDFINKPIDAQELALRVRNALYGKRLFDRLQENYRHLQQMQELRDDLTRMLEADTRTLTVIMEHLKIAMPAAKGRTGGDADGQDR